jgi:hypothetical protein
VAVEGKMERRNERGMRSWAWTTSVILVGCVLVFQTGWSQLSGFTSVGYGYNSNPLYNYETIGDRILQGYVEIQHRAEWSRSFLGTSYVGGLMLFDQLRERTYYEHSLYSHYLMKMGSKSPSTDAARLEDERNGNEDDRDSSETYLDVGARLSARHDREEYREFDNLGVELIGSWRFPLSSFLFGRVSDQAGYRSYVHLTDLSNLTNQILFDVGAYIPNKLSYGGIVAFGVKSFTKAAYDTSVFTTPSEIATKSQGKGKGGSKLVTTNSKKVLANGTHDFSCQLSVAGYAERTWGTGALRGTFGYRTNLGTESRYLAQYANSTFLNEDIYNDHFSYEGPDARLFFRQTIPGKIQVNVAATAQRKRFSAPALALDGTQTADNRIDLHGNVDVTVSRYFSLSDAIGLDAGITGTLARNQSNDAYNDYSAQSIAISFGIGW